MARDKFHQQVRIALEKEGWDITDDPLPEKLGTFFVMIDLGLEKIIIAEQSNRKIAVEIKTFGKGSLITDLYEAVGKYLLYKEILEQNKNYRDLYLAIPEDKYELLAKEPLATGIFKKYDFKIIVYQEETQEIVSWIE